MRTFRFLHCADLHLDSPLRGLEADPDAPADTIRGATREALKNLVDFAINDRVDFVVAAGDLYDGDWQDWRTGHFLVGQIARLANAGIPFVAIRGNHDAASVITKNLRLPGEYTKLLHETEPETFRLPNLPVSIHGQSFANREIPENLAKTYPPADPDRFNIGLLHSSVDGTYGHKRYAPCSIDDLRDRDYQYWALGHVHGRRILHSNPWIVFPGNLQGRDITETGSKGATLVTVTDGKITGEPTHIAFDTVRWARVDAVLNETDDENTALNRVRAALAEAMEQADGRLLAARVLVSGACAAHEAFARDPGGTRARIRGEALAVADPGKVWIEAVEIMTRPPSDLTSPRDQQNAIGTMARALETIAPADIEEEARRYAAAMLDRAGPLRQAIGAEHAAARVAAGEIPEDLLRRARDLLLAALAEA